MLYSLDISTPAKTLISSKQPTVQKVWKGMLHRFEIYFPPGSAGLLYCQVCVGGHQVIPSTEGMYLRGDSIKFEGPLFFDLKDLLNVVTVKTWNLDDVYPHRVFVNLYVLPKSVLIPVGATEGIVAALKSLFVDRWKVEQQEVKEEE